VYDDINHEILLARRFASAVLAMALCFCLFVCVSVRLLVTSRCFIKTAEQIDLDFGTEATVRLSYIVLYRNSSISKHKGTSH